MKFRSEIIEMRFEILDIRYEKTSMVIHERLVDHFDSIIRNQLVVRWS